MELHQIVPPLTYFFPKTLHTHLFLCSWRWRPEESELVRMSSASMASSPCNFNNGSQMPLPLSPCCLAAGLNTARRRNRSLTSSSLSKLLGGVHLSSYTPSNLSVLHKEHKRNFSVFAMAVDGLSLSVVNFLYRFGGKLRNLVNLVFII